LRMLKARSLIARSWKCRPAGRAEVQREQCHQLHKICSGNHHRSGPTACHQFAIRTPQLAGQGARSSGCVALHQRETAQTDRAERVRLRAPRTRRETEYAYGRKKCSEKLTGSFDMSGGHFRKERKRHYRRWVKRNGCKPFFVRGVQYKVEVSLLQLARNDLSDRGKLIQSHVCL